MTRLALLPLFLISCTNDKDDSGTTDTAPVGCDVTVTTLPNQGATDWYYRGNIEFALSAPDATATITCDAAGHQETSADGLRIIWVLDEPMDPGTAYTCTLDYCGGVVDLGYTTSSLGTEVSDPDGLVGRTYVLDLTAARITDPPGIGSVLTSYLTTDILIGVTGVTDTSIDLMGSIAVTDSSPPEQDMCTETIDFGTADFSESPFFSIGPADTVFNVAGYEVSIESLLIEGTFAADGNYFDGGKLSGTIDTRPLAGLVEEGNENAICELAVNFGAECTPCPADGLPFCLTLVADQIYAEMVDDLTLEERSADDVAGDPSCL